MILPAVLLAPVAGCRSESPGTTVVVLDTTPRRDTLEVIALPVDPATLAGSSSLPQDDAARRASMLRDSAAAADARFQRLRDTLNAETRAMQGADRLSRAYHRHFDGWRQRMLVADSLRVVRDRLRARAARSGPMPGTAQSTVRATLLAATSPDGRHAIAQKVAGGDSIRLDLSDGDWWIGAAPVAAAPVRWHRAAAGRIRIQP